MDEFTQGSLGFGVEARSVTMRRGYGGWVVEVRVKRECSPWGELVRYDMLTYDEASDVAFIELGFS